MDHCHRFRIERAQESRPMRFVLLSLAAVLVFVICNAPSLGQSTFGTILGTVRDASGAVVSGATIELTNAGTSAKRTTTTDDAGSFSFVNVAPGIYQLVMESSGFQKTEFPNLDLQARETKRLDANLKVATSAQTVMVEAAAAVVTTDVSNLAETKTGRELVDLPVAIFSRQSGSTSPISTLTTQPGVQTDDSGNLTIAGATPALLSYTIDGISSVSVENSGPLSELFPSFNSIAEIRVGETNNNAEFSGVSDVTTISKSGTNAYHGGLFENHEDAGLNAGNPFVSPKGKLVMNDFGGFFGGPVMLPKVYNGSDRTFFFLSYEGLRLAKAAPLVESVPTGDMRAGNLCNWLTDPKTGTVKNIYQPNGTQIPCGSVPVSSVAQNVLNSLLPAQNFGSSTLFSNNFRENFPTPVSSNQGDMRIDQNLTSKHTVYARFTYKSREVTKAPSSPDCLALSFCSTLGSPSTGAFLVPEKDYGLTVAYNYVITPALFNEVRAGFNTLHLETTQNINPGALLSQVGITGIPDIPNAPSVPNFQVLGFQSTGGGNPSVQRSNIFQILDNLTWTKQKHTFKFGADFRRMTDHDDNVFGSTRLGQYVFNGSSAVGATINDPFTQFLLGYPDYTVLSQVKNPNMNGLGYSYAFFGQDDWKVTPSFTLNFGLRWELHPPLRDTQSNTADFLPNWTGTVNGQTVQGAVVVPNAKGLSWTEPAFAASIAPTPILTAAQAGVPSALRYTDKKDFGPRIGFAWRPFHNDRTVIRGGFGRFIESPLGFSLVSGWAVSASSVSVYNQAYASDNVTPSLSFPSPFPANLNVTGTQSFYYAFPLRYHDPTVMQWNLTFERDLGFGTGLRLSYTGSHGSNLETMVDLNQVPANSVGYAMASANKPFPIWGVLQSVSNSAESNYNSLTADFKKRYAHGFQFESTYSFTRDLSDEGGAVPNAFVGAGGNFVTDRFHPGLDYGNVVYDRRHRFLTTYLYELPVGQGKRFLNGSNRLVDGAVGGWEVAGVLLFQSGPFLTPSESSVDPAGTNITTTVGPTRPDIVAGTSPYAHGLTNATGPVYLNPSAFALPAANTGRFGNASVGSVVGPSTKAVSMSLIKTVKFTETAKMQFGAEVANLFNHRNYEPPTMAIDNANFGVISGLQTAEGAGPRNVQLTARISF
jgi:hypothetical protein